MLAQEIRGNPGNRCDGRAEENAERRTNRGVSIDVAAAENRRPLDHGLNNSEAGRGQCRLRRALSRPSHKNRSLWGEVPVS